MRCPEREADLLLLGLGELAWWSGWRVRLHLRRCSRCRARQAELMGVSHQLAQALGPTGGSGTGGGTGLPTHAFPLGLFALAIVLSLMTATVLTVQYFRSHTAVRCAVRDVGCLPGLPSDKCR